MKELKVGNYIRTKDKKGVQYIRKIIDLPKDTRYGSIVVDKDIHNVKWVSKKNVLKVSENIIDLIEPGDYVNGRKVDKIAFVDGDYYIKTKVSNTGNYDYLPEHLIEDIVTKEQFESVKYEVKENE